MLDVEAVSKALVEGAKAYTLRLTKALSERMEALEARVAAIPKGENGKSITVDDVRPILDQAVTQLRADADEAIKEPLSLAEAARDKLLQALGELRQPKDGRSVTVEDVAPLVTDLVDKAAASLPSQDDIRMMIVEAVSKATAEIPSPEPIDYDRIEKMVDAAVARAVADIPVPANGKDADPEAIKSMVEDAVQERMAAIPKGEDGKSVTAEEVAPMLASLVKEAAAAIPAPKDGRDVDPDAVRGMVAEAVSVAIKGIEPPAVDYQRMGEAVDAAVARAVAAIPAPRDGRDIEPDVVRAMVIEAVAKAAEAIRPSAAEPVDYERVVRMVERVVGLATPSLDVVQRLVDDAVKAIPRVDDAELSGQIRDAVKAAAADLPAPQGGSPGKDAAEIDPLPEIDMEKSYSVGTWAVHDGGLWVARRRTKGIDGWHCVVRGLKSFEVQAGDDPREVSVCYAMTDSPTKSLGVRVPMVIEKGIYRPQETYSTGDGVTYGGSFWIAKRDGVSSSPGTVEGDWRLSVKKGRDGRSAYDLARANGFEGTEADWLKSLKK